MRAALAKLRGVVLAALGLTLGLLAPAAYAQSTTDLTTYYQWDDLRRLKMKIGPDPDGPGGRPRKAEVYNYLPDGELTRIDVGTTAQATESDFVSVQSKSFGYDPVGNRTSESLSGTSPVSGTSLVSLTQFSYDADDRLTCTAVRMALTSQTDACVPGPSTSAGTDRITRNSYDAAGQLIKVEKAVGTDLAMPYARYAYSANGKQTSVTDSSGWDASHPDAGGMTTMVYDGFDRLIRQIFPVTERGGTGNTTAASNLADYEAYTYDANGNRTSLRKRAEGRDGRVAGSNIIGFEYDALNRMIWKRIPPAYKTGNVTDISYSYDLQDHMLSAAYQIPNKAITFTYDKAGRKTEERSYGLSIYSDYDAAGNRRHLTLPGGKITEYTYDAAGLVMSITQDGLAVASFSYDGLGRRLSLSRGADPDTTTYDFTEPGGRLASLTNALVGANNTSTETLSYNPAGQIATLAQASPTYVWQGQPTAVRDRTFDGLNRDLTYAALDGGYDFNGNLTRDDYRSFQYDVENRLILTQNTGSSSSVQANFSQEAYDPLGRLRALYWTDGTGVNGGITYFLNDGDRMVAEYAQNALDPNAGFAVKSPLPPALRRYVHGPGTDEPLVWFEGDQTSTAYWLHANRQGSIIAVSTQSGAALSINGSPLQYTYGPYGEPQDWKGSRFRYTGQMAWGEVGLYYYKARVYDPAQGRFLQTDPVGYDAGLNMYAYVNDDPTNRTDPTGNVVECQSSASDCGRITDLINKESYKQYRFEKGQLQVDPKHTNSAGSKKYSNAIDKGVAAKAVIGVRIGSTITDSARTKSGREITGAWPVAESGQGATRTDGRQVVITGASTTVAGQGGREITDSPADILMHEIVEHAVPRAVDRYDRPGVSDENAVRRELGLPERSGTDHANY